jgi:hypothetical protein
MSVGTEFGREGFVLFQTDIWQIVKSPLDNFIIT